MLALCLVNCTLTDNTQIEPAYLEITSVDIVTTTAEGEPTHNLTDVWAYADNQLLGVFEVPCKIPIILNAETTEFLIFPGFRNNGEQSRSFTYNLMEQARFTESLAPGETVKKDLVFKYKDDAIFDFVENFEGGSHIFTNDLDEDFGTSIEVSSEDVRSGAQSGKISLTSDNPVLLVANIFEYDRANNGGADNYFEMDYKNDVPFSVGVIFEQECQRISQPLIILNESEEWNKIYIDFTSVLSSPVIDSYTVLITTDLDALNRTEGTIYLDNLKFVHL